ncbi:hypothetical protein Vafri_15817, partial [Volvox africanus]
MLDGRWLARMRGSVGELEVRDLGGNTRGLCGCERTAKALTDRTGSLHGSAGARGRCGTHGSVGCGLLRDLGGGRSCCCEDEGLPRWLQIISSEISRQQGFRQLKSVIDYTS